MDNSRKILVVWSNYYSELAEKYLATCTQLLDQSHYEYQVETVAAGTYELPAVMLNYHRNQAFAGYIPLGLLVKGATDHYEFIWQHVKECFIQFTMQGLLFGNGIISAPSMDILTARIENGERVHEAFKAVDYLIRLNKKLEK